MFEVIINGYKIRVFYYKLLHIRIGNAELQYTNSVSELNWIEIIHQLISPPLLILSETQTLLRLFLDNFNIVLVFECSNSFKM